MPRFFVYDQPLDGGFLVLTGENAAYSRLYLAQRQLETLEEEDA